jgi:hypothetical protein
LNATLLGLLTAIPSLIAWSYYNKKVETLAVEMETLCDEFLRQHYRHVPHESPAAGPGSPAPESLTAPTNPSFEGGSTMMPDASAPHGVSAEEDRPPRRARKSQQG